MATIRARKDKKGNIHFHVQVRRAGYPARTASFSTQRLAKRWATKIEAEMEEGRHFKNVHARRHTLAEAIDKYALEEAPKKRDVRTRLIRLRWWKGKLGHLKLSDISAETIAEHKGVLERETYTRISRGQPAEGTKPKRRQRGSSTINRYLATLSHVFTIAKKEWHWTDSDPFASVSKLPESKGRIRFLKEAERAALLAETAKDPQLHVLVVLALATAARASELLHLNWADLELDEGRAILRGKPDATGKQRTKNDTARAVWLHGEALKLLKEHQARGLHPVRVFVATKGGEGVYDYDGPFAAACQRANVQSFNFHDLRHSSATYLARMGATEQQLKAIGGWKSNVVSRYVHLAAEDTKALQEQMNNRILGSPIEKTKEA